MDIKKEEILILNDPGFKKENVCIVTGAGSGIGRATAIALSANELFVVGLDINEAEGNETSEIIRKMGHKMVFIKTDLTDDSQIESAVNASAKLGSIRFLSNIAGIQHIDSVDNFPMDKYDLMQKIMLRAPFYLSKLVIPHLKNSIDGIGVIGNMASVHAHICTKNKPAYNIIKFGLRGLTQSISAEGDGKIRSFTISTGFVRTPLMTNQVEEQAKQRGISPEEVATDVMMGSSRVKEMMTPVEVANLFVIGFSHYSKYLVGGDMLFDGGMVKTY